MIMQSVTPSRKPSRRVDAPPAAVRAGFELYPIGVTVLLRRDEGDGDYVLLGHIADGAAGNPECPSWNVGRYCDAHEGCIEISGLAGHGMTLREAISAASLLPDIDDQVRTYDTIQAALEDRPHFGL